MLRLSGDTQDIEVTGRIAEWIVLFWKRITVSPPKVLDDYQYVLDDPAAVRYMKRKRRRCTLNGHIWEFTGLDPSRNEYTIECFRCHPHIDSRRVIVSYNPFSTVQRKTD